MLKESWSLCLTSSLMRCTSGTFSVTSWWWSWRTWWLSVQTCMSLSWALPSMQKNSHSISVSLDIFKLHLCYSNCREILTVLQWVYRYFHLLWMQRSLKRNSQSFSVSFKFFKLFLSLVAKYARREKISVFHKRQATELIFLYMYKNI